MATLRTHKNQLVIGLAGYAGVGKNAIADALGIPTASFAQRLKDDVGYLLAQRLGLRIDKSREDKEKARELLVAYGRLARQVKPDFWIDNIDIPPGDIVAVTDVRYLNEANAILKAGGIVVYIDRPGFVAVNPEEDFSLRYVVGTLDGAERFARVTNSGSIEWAAQQVRSIVCRLEQGRCSMLPNADACGTTDGHTPIPYNEDFYKEDPLSC